MKNLFLILPILLFLSSCAEMNSKFDCPMKPGVSCASLDQINAKVDRGEISNEPADLTYQPSTKNTSFHQVELSNSTLPKDLSARKPLRYGETVMHVWVAPFEDTSGNYHQENDIYTIVKSGHWIGHPVKTTSNDEE